MLTKKIRDDDVNEVDNPKYDSCMTSLLVLTI